MNKRKKNNIIIGALCTVLLLMVVGYAAFQSVLKINGTTNISSDWDVRITAIEKTAGVGATDKEAPTYDNTKGLSATFNTNLTSPGDYATYKITITNNGSLDAILKNITIPENTNNDIKFYLNKDQNNTDITGSLKQNDTLTKASESNNVGYVYVTVLYRDYANQQTATTKTASMTISFDFEQADDSETPIIPTPLISVYAYHTDTKKVGTSVLTEADYKTDYTELDSYKAGKAWFLKYEIHSDGLIKSAYACQKFTFIDKPVCMQGHKDPGNNIYYISNKTILEGLQTTFTANSGSCSFEESSSRCDFGSRYVGARSIADVNAYAGGGNEYCRVISDGSVHCFE